jgi:hypothetical protein
MAKTSLKEIVEKLGYEGLTGASQCSTAKKMFLGLEKSEKLTKEQKEQDEFTTEQITQYLIAVAIGGAKEETKEIAKQILDEFGFEGDLEEIRKEKNRQAKARANKNVKEKLELAEELEVSRNFYVKQLNAFAEAIKDCDSMEELAKIKRKAKDIHKPFNL